MLSPFLMLRKRKELGKKVKRRSQKQKEEGEKKAAEAKKAIKANKERGK